MDDAPPRPGRLFTLIPSIKLKFRRDNPSEGLSEVELEALGSVLPELVGELLQMSQDSESE